VERFLQAIIPAFIYIFIKYGYQNNSQQSLASCFNAMFFVREDLIRCIMMGGLSIALCELIEGIKGAFWLEDHT
jgi:hypothetical protein